MQQRALQHAMAGLALLLEHTQVPLPLDPISWGRAGIANPKLPLGTIHDMSHAALIQLQRNSGAVNPRYAPEPSVRLENVRLALALLSRLVCYRMWSFGVQQFLKLVTTTMQKHSTCVEVQLHGATILAKHCQLRSYDAYIAVRAAGAVELLVALIARDGATYAGSEPDTSTAAEAVVATACHALNLLLEAKLASAFARDEHEMKLRRAALLNDTVKANGIEALVGVLASHYTHGAIPPPQVCSCSRSNMPPILQCSDI